MISEQYLKLQKTLQVDAVVGPVGYTAILTNIMWALNANPDAEVSVDIVA